MDKSGTRYKLDGEWRDLESRDVTLPVKLGPLVLPIRRTVHHSVHGPVIKNDNGAFAIRYGGIDNIGQLDAYYRLNKAKNFEEWRSILARMDIPSTNFVYADREGNIGYFYNAAIPARPKGPDWRNVLDGSNSKLIWNETVDFEAIPKLVNPASGWLYNANNMPYSAAGPGSDLSPDSVAPELGVELKMTNRARRAEKLLAETPVIDRANLERIKYDTGYERVGYVADMLDAVAALDVSDDERLQRAQRLLANWDFTADSVGPGDALSLLMIRPWMSAEYQNKPLPDAREELQRSVDHLITHFGKLDPPMSELLRLRQGRHRSSARRRQRHAARLNAVGRRRGRTPFRTARRQLPDVRRMGTGTARALAIDPALWRGDNPAAQRSLRRSGTAFRAARAEAGPFLARRCAAQRHSSKNRQQPPIIR